MIKYEYTLEEFYEKIGVTREIQEVLPQISEEEYLRYKDLFENHRDEFFVVTECERNHRQLILALFLRMAFEKQEDYRKRNISYEIYFDTFKDICVWVRNCKRDYGECGLEEYHWIKNHIDMNLFRLGRLQFQLISGKEMAELNMHSLDAQEYAINLHIPQDEPLHFEDCLDSFARAGEFFAGIKIKETTCHSWLLSPALRELLPESSNILRFQSLFDVYALEKDTKEAEERVFHCVRDNPEDYPEDTTLQRALRAYLIQGNHPGSALGLLKREYDQTR